MSALLIAHGLEGAAASEVEKAAGSFVIHGEEKLDSERGALWGGLVSGALSGPAPERWRAAVTAQHAENAESWAGAWQRAQAEGAAHEACVQTLEPLIGQTLRRLPADAYPSAAVLLRG